MAKPQYNDARYKAAKRRMKGMPCFQCGRRADSVDHIIPISKGGTSEMANLRPACLRCNVRRGNRVSKRWVGGVF